MLIFNTQIQLTEIRLVCFAQELAPFIIKFVKLQYYTDLVSSGRPLQTKANKLNFRNDTKQNNACDYLLFHPIQRSTHLQDKQFYMKSSSQFNFRKLQKKYNPNPAKSQQQTQTLTRLSLFQDFVVNPKVVEECAKVEKDYRIFYNNNRYFYLHDDPQNIDAIQKIKKEEFQQIRKQSEKKATFENKTQTIKQSPQMPRKRISKTQRQIRFRFLSYKFRKTIKQIVLRLKALKITLSDIFQRKLFSDEPYQFGKDIFEAVKFGEQTKVWRYYIENKFVIYSVDSTRKTPLIWCCIRGFSTVAQLLMSIGGLPNRKDLLGHTALYYAVTYGHFQCVKVLILNEALITQQDTVIAKDKKMKNVLQLGLSILPIIRRIPYERRVQMFQERLKQIK